VIKRIITLLIGALVLALELLPLRAAPPDGLDTLCWVAYAPTNYDPDSVPPRYPSRESILADLRALRSYGFTGLITYGSDGTLGTLIPRLAQGEGFSGVLMGIWNPDRTNATGLQEYNNAIAASSRVSGYIVGNEGLSTRYNINTLQTTINDLRIATNKPVTTTEEWPDYTDVNLRNLGDWLMPNAHDMTNGVPNQDDPTVAASFAYNTIHQLFVGYGRPFLLKEVGLPSGGSVPGKTFDPFRQAEYYRQLRLLGARFAYFEAFDALFKPPGLERTWGLFTSSRAPKVVVQYGYPCTNRSIQLTPVNGSSTMLSQPTFSWRSVNIPGYTYEFQYGTTNPPLTTKATTTNRYQAGCPMPPGNYIWRVRVKNPAGIFSPWSETWLATLNSATTGAPMRNRYIVNNPLLRWGGVTNVTNWQIEVSTSAAFSPLTFAATLPGSQLQVTLPALTDGCYFWRVRAQRDGTWRGWSGTEGFSIDALP
jgi:exo-beta-1,3-glucanase (GH17 family)